MAAQDIVYAITQLVRVAGAIQDWRRSELLEKDIDLAIRLADPPNVDFARFALASERTKAQLVAAVPSAGQFLGDVSGLKAECPASVRRAIEDFGRGLYVRAREGGGDAKVLKLDTPTATVIKHWKENAPRTPKQRLGLRLLGIAIETAAANPRIFKASESGEKLISGFLTHIVELLPDENDPGPLRVPFWERTASIMLTAGARVIDENADAIWDQPRLQELGRALVEPLRTRLDAAIDDPQNAYKMVRVENIRDDLLAPMTHAALGVVARHQKGFLGASFATEKTLGAVTETLIDAALSDQFDGHVLRVFSRPGFVQLSEHMLTLVAEKPQLFVRGRSESTEIVRNAVAGMARVMGAQGVLPPYDRDVAAQVAAAAIDAVAGGLPALLLDDDPEKQKPWDIAGANVLASILTGFSSGVRDQAKNPFERLFSREQAVDVVRVIATQAALTPGMITGKDSNPEVQRIAKHVAELVSAPGAALLTPTMWTGVISSLMREAAANPGVLFSIDEETAEQALAIHLVTDLFEVAATAWTAAGERRTPGLRLFGETLADAASTVARAAVRNAAKALTKEGREAAQNLAKALNAAAADSAVRLSDADWRFLYKTWIAQVIETGKVPEQKPLLDTLYVRQQQRATAPPAGDPPPPAPNGGDGGNGVPNNSDP
ncbi:MAG: hypothetical protein GC206_04915 [Alphaproteobacteria bacterium]|nr:hypothetical protein [Alphaproteobacteria bacterium]